MTTNQVLCFVSWLMKRGLEAKTINAYLSGLRTIHLIKGIDETTLRPAIVAAILEGKAHIDTMRKRLSNKPARVPITLNVLKLLKAAINRWETCDQMKLLIWSVCLICFFGGFRIHEILNRTKTTYDPAFALLGRDVKVVKLKIKAEVISVLQVLIKSPKEDRIGKNHVIDVYETKAKILPCQIFYQMARMQSTKIFRKACFP